MNHGPAWKKIENEDRTYRPAFVWLVSQFLRVSKIHDITYGSIYKKISC